MVAPGRVLSGEGEEARGRGRAMEAPSPDTVTFYLKLRRDLHRLTAEITDSDCLLNMKRMTLYEMMGLPMDQRMLIRDGAELREARTPEAVLKARAEYERVLETSCRCQDEFELKSAAVAQMERRYAFY